MLYPSLYMCCTHLFIYVCVSGLPVSSAMARPRDGKGICSISNVAMRSVKMRFSGGFLRLNLNITVPDSSAFMTSCIRCILGSMASVGKQGRS